MFDGAEYLYPYDHLGRLHNEGVGYVIQKLNSSDQLFNFTQQRVLELAAEFMYYMDCCDTKLDDFFKPGFILSKIRYTQFLEFLVNLQNELKSKSVTELAKEAEINAELLPIIEMIFFNASNIEEISPNAIPTVMEPTFQMLDFLEKKSFEKSVRNQIRGVGLLTAVSRSSIEYGQNVLLNPILKANHENVNSKAFASTIAPENERKKFRWSWKADVEGALGGLVSGGVGGILAGPFSAAVGGLLGAVGGSISNSVIKSIPAFASVNK